MNDAPRLLVFGGPYSNLEATEAVLNEALRLRIPFERVICTGDVIAYCADPAATSELVRMAGIRVVMGNCEESLGFGAPDCGCGFAEGSLCDQLSAGWYKHADRELGPEARSWMRSLPRALDLELGNRRIKVVHGTPSEISRFVFESTPSSEKAQALDAANCDGIIAGHCGLPFTQFIGQRLWHNPGAIGMPANDGTPRGWFSVLTSGKDGILIEHHPLHFDHAAAARKIRDRGLPEAYAQALVTGRWPSCDILPAAELAATGQPLAPEPALWPSRGRGEQERGTPHGRGSPDRRFGRSHVGA